MSVDESSPNMTPSRNSVALAVAVAVLSGCGPLVQIGGNTPAPAALLTLRAEALTNAVPAKPDATLMVSQPTVPGALQTLRLPVTTADTELQYLKDGSWIEQPAKLFQRLLIDVVAAKAGVIALDGRNPEIMSQRKLTGQLLEFGLDVRSSPVVRVRYDAALTGNAGKLLAVRSFTASQPVTAQTPGEIAAALNRAANSVAGDVADWVAAN